MAVEPGLGSEFSQAAEELTARRGDDEDADVGAVHEREAELRTLDHNHDVRNLGDGDSTSETGRHARTVSGRIAQQANARKKRDEEFYDTLLLLQQQLEGLNADIAGIRDDIAGLESQIAEIHGENFDHYYADKYLDEDFQRQHNDETREEYRMRIANAIRAKVEHGEITIDKANDPYLKKWLDHYKDLKDRLDKVEEVTRELEAIEAGSTGAELVINEEFNRRVSNLDSAASDIDAHTENTDLIAAADEVDIQNFYEKETDGMDAFLAQANEDVQTSHADSINEGIAPGHTSQKEFALASSSTNDENATDTDNTPDHPLSHEIKSSLT